MKSHRWLRTCLTCQQASPPIARLLEAKLHSFDLDALARLLRGLLQCFALLIQGIIRNPGLSRMGAWLSLCRNGVNELVQNIVDMPFATLSGRSAESLQTRPRCIEVACHLWEC